MIWVRRVAIGMIALMAVSLAPAATQAAPDRAPSSKPAASKWQPKQGAFFNVPRAGDRQFTLHQQIVAAIRHAKKGSLIRIAVFSFDRTFVAQELIKAHKRGVQVQVLLNNHQVTPAQKMLHRALGHDRHKKSFAYECSRGCRSRGENQHIKFYLFSKTGAAKDVVMTGSVNLTSNSAMNQYNDLWVKNNAPSLFGSFSHLFDSMRKDKVARPGYWVDNIGKTYQLQATPFPHFGPKHDPIITMLNRVKCKGATRGTGNAIHHTVVRVIMHAWNDDRGHYLAQKIRQLYAKGCDVKIMYGFAGASVRDVIANKTPRGYLPAHTTGYDTDEDGFIDLYTHQKELLISGNYGKNSATSLVVTGSSNWNDDGLRGDEEIFVIKRKGAFQQYIRDFQFMWASKSHLVHYVPYGVPVIDPMSPDGDLSERRASSDDTELKRGGPAWESD